MGRVLRNAGYTVSFAVDRDEAVRAPDADLIVLNSELASDPETLAAQLKETDQTPTTIVTCPPRDLKAWRKALREAQNVMATDGYAPPENVLFIANEAAHSRRENNRATPRLLYGTTVLFRGAGRESDDFGYAYNVSAGGLYVRTLAPPDDDEVWLELSPPRTERRVRLVGRVVWRRGLGGGEYATVPPGFGVQITDAAQADLELWRAGYEAFLAAIG